MPNRRAVADRPRRSYGEGSIVERERRGKKYFVALVSGGVDEFGRRRRLERWCASYREARAALSTLEAELRSDAPRAPRAPRAPYRPRVS